MKTQYLLPFLLLIISCSSHNNEIVTVTAEANTDYLITTQNNRLYFTVSEISYEEDENFLEERIKYNLYKTSSSLYDPRKSFIKYKRTKQQDGSFLLEEIEGSKTLSEADISFNWSFGSNNHIYLYLPAKYNFEAIE